MHTTKFRVEHDPYRAVSAFHGSAPRRFPWAVAVSSASPNLIVWSRHRTQEAAAKAAAKLNRA